jgi:hypothetical protein
MKSPVPTSSIDVCVVVLVIALTPAGIKYAAALPPTASAAKSMKRLSPFMAVSLSRK